MPSSPIQISVNVRNIAVGGSGVGEVLSQDDGREDLLGITAFVPFTAVGEQVLARVVQKKDRYIQAQLVSVTKSSTSRTSPECKLFTQCGGCELQHLNYQAQLDAKYDMILGAMRSAKFLSSDLEKLEFVVSSPAYRYRRRICLHIDSSGKVGFYRESSRSVVPTDSCPVAVSHINESLKEIADFGREVKGKVSSLIMDSDEEGVIAVLKSPYDLSNQTSRAILDIAKKFFSSTILLAGEKEVGGFGRQILEIPLTEHKTVTLRVPAGNFSQVNSTVNIKLIAKTLELLAPQKGQEVFDLYSGAGNFSLPIAKTGANVTAVECDKRLVDIGRENATRYGLQKNLEFIQSSSEKFIDKYAQSKNTPDVIVADPPRSGLGALTANLPLANKLILVSCQLPSFIRDTKNLCERGWKIKQIIPFDMFAQTSYVEILALLER